VVILTAAPLRHWRRRSACRCGWQTTEPELQHHRQEEWNGADTDAKERPAPHRDLEGRDARQREIQDRMPVRAGVRRIGKSATGRARQEQEPVKPVYHAPIEQFQADHKERQGQSLISPGPTADRIPACVWLRPGNSSAAQPRCR